MSLCDVADDPGELPGARPHRPVARRQVDPGHVAQLGETAEPSRVVLLGVGLHLLGREPRADDGARDVATRVVRQLRSLAQDAARLRNRSPPKGLELLLAEPVEVLLVRELLLGGQGHLDAIEVGVHCADPRGGVDIHHGRDPVGEPVARGIAGEPGAAVHGEHDGSPRRLDRLADRVDVVRHGDRGSVGVGRLEAGQRHRGDVVAVGTQRGGDLVPRPRAEPEPGNQDDRCGSHSSTLAASRRAWIPAQAAGPQGSPGSARRSARPRRPLPQAPRGSSSRRRSPA